MADLLGAALRLNRGAAPDGGGNDGNVTNDPYSNRAKRQYHVDLTSYNPSTMVGRYHAFKVKSKFPIPGAAVMDDYRRRRLAATADSLDEQLVDIRERRAELGRVEREIAEGRQHARAPTELERLLERFETTLEEKESVVREIEQEPRAIPSSDEQEKVFRLIKEHKMAELEHMFDRGEVNVNAVEPRLDTTGLMMASTQGLSHAVRLFLRFGADPNRTNTTGLRAIHMVWHSWLRTPPESPRRALVYRSMVEIVRLILEFDGDPNAATHDLRTPLHMAAQYGHDEIALLLLKVRRKRLI